MKSITINRSLRLRDEPSTGHNRWHPDLAPVIAADVGEEVVLETRDASDGNVVYGSEVMSYGPNKAVHPLTGPASGSNGVTFDALTMREENDATICSCGGAPWP